MLRFSDSLCLARDAVPMRRVIFLLSTTVAILAFLASSRLIPSQQSESLPSTEFTYELLTDLDTYENADYGFSVAIPAGWSPVIAEVDKEDIFIEPGYAIGFESSRQG